MIGKTNAQSKNSGTAYEFECTTYAGGGNWYNTNIPIEGVSRIFLQYQSFANDGRVTACGEMDTVSNGVLTKKYAVTGSNGINNATSLKVVDGMIYFGQVTTNSAKLAYVHMTLYH